MPYCGMAAMMSAANPSDRHNPHSTNQGDVVDCYESRLSGQDHLDRD